VFNKKYKKSKSRNANGQNNFDCKTDSLRLKKLLTACGSGESGGLPTKTR
jgi:hypothetical protein